MKPLRHVNNEEFIEDLSKKMSLYTTISTKKNVKILS